MSNEIELSNRDLDDWKFMIKELMDVKEKFKYFQSVFISTKARTDYAKYVLKISQIVAEMRNLSHPSHRHLFTKMKDEGTALGAITELLNQVNEDSINELLVTVQAMANGYPVDFVRYDKGTTDEERKQCAELNSLFGNVDQEKRNKIIQFAKSVA
ncbi:hypothetical protein [Rhizosphaericola mali]|uniref:Uncharacterized protein n=1 Tax=Rhizosphaericola mali TaxID=2545455 RepID=A0A5P2G297_9BACT|nr:hypothetical protein [Rhizosphaericola mali]QES88838.1 hypothetical protein E0W69_009290 [Rhizosphaericola mali]